MAFELPITAFRHAPWGGPSGLADLIRIADDWSGAAFQWSFAASPGSAALISLANAGEAAQGVSASFDEDYIHPTSGAIVGATTIRPLILRPTLEGLPSPTPASADIVLYHTLYVTPVDAPARVLCFGDFTIKQGAPI